MRSVHARPRHSATEGVLNSKGELAERLRLIVITDSGLAHPRSVVDVVEGALEAGAPAIQLRNSGASAIDLLAVGRELRSLSLAHGALFFVNDRLDVALALEADGVHLGPEDPPVVAVRRAVGAGFLIGRSADDPVVAQRAVDDGASYIGCGAVYPTSTKPNAGDVIGIEGLHKVVRRVRAPVIAIGGVTPERVAQVASSGASGVAVVGSIMAASDVAPVVRALLSPWQPPQAD